MFFPFAIVFLDLIAEKGDLMPCDNCYRSFHSDCSSASKPNEKAWLCQICQEQERKTCAISGELIEEPSRNLILQCTLCYGK
jgi:hypothetical protein